MAKTIGDKSCQSNFDKRLSDVGSFLVTNVSKNLSYLSTHHYCRSCRISVQIL